jgi:hypothetical protein
MDIGSLLKGGIDKAFNEALKEKNKELADFLIKYIKDPFLLLDYALVFKERLKPEFEDIVAKDKDASLGYAVDVLEGPFPKGEDEMAQDLYTAYHYAADALKGPFPKGEPIISQFPYSSYYYAKDVLHDRFPKGEKAIIDSKGQVWEYESDDYLNLYIEFLKSINKLNEFLKDHPEVKI